MTARMRHDSCLGLGERGFHRLHYLEWGEPANSRVLFCVHGLTRNARDFDVLARRLSRRYRVICPDVVGRGQSDWLRDPAGYAFPQYLADMCVLIARSGAQRVDWVGTSMGGLIGMLLAAQPGTPLRRLVLNDIGPYIPIEAIRRIGEYVGEDPWFPDLDAMERRLRRICEGFGELSDDEWRHLALHGAVQRDGGVRFAYDPAIRAGFDAIDADVDLWPVFESLDQDILILRGADSDVLDRNTAVRMLRRDAPTRLVEFERVGHAPMLMDEDQIDVVADWLDAQS